MTGWSFTTVPQTRNGTTVTKYTDKVPIANGFNWGTRFPADNLVVTFQDVTSIEGFAYCTRLASVTIGNSVTGIGQQAFTGCTSLASVTFTSMIPSDGFNSGWNTFPGDLRDKFYASNASNGTPGTYATANPGENAVWSRL